MQTRTWTALLLLTILAGAAIGCKSANPANRDGSAKSTNDQRALERAAAKRAYDADPNSYHEPIGAD
jgi:hypothetical protein